VAKHDKAAVKRRARFINLKVMLASFLADSETLDIYEMVDVRQWSLGDLMKWPFQRGGKSRIDPWAAIRTEVAARRFIRRDSPANFNVIPLVELARYGSLPVFQNLDSRVTVHESELDASDRITLFISHRWCSPLVPDDGTLIDRIFQFCLNVVIKNNFPALAQTHEVHHSKSLSQKLTDLIQTIDPAGVVDRAPSFQRYKRVIASISPDPLQRRLIHEVLARFYLWIDFCCLPQVYAASGRRVERTEAEDEVFLSGLDRMDTLLEKSETVIIWTPSEITRAWLFYESLMSIPRGSCSFMLPMDLIAALSTSVHQFHCMFSQLGALNGLLMVDTFEKLGIVATSHRDITKIILLMESNLGGSDWRFRVIR